MRYHTVLGCCRYPNKNILLCIDDFFLRKALNLQKERIENQHFLAADQTAFNRTIIELKLLQDSERVRG